jgi:hypothetical protein
MREDHEAHKSSVSSADVKNGEAYTALIHTWRGD